MLSIQYLLLCSSFTLLYGEVKNRSKSFPVPNGAGKMLAGEEGDYMKRSDGSYAVQNDGTHFHHILAYLRSRTLSEDVIEQDTESLLADAEFYMLPGLKGRINYEKVNDKEFVLMTKNLSLIPHPSLPQIWYSV